MKWKPTHWVSEDDRFLIIESCGRFLLIDRQSAGKSQSADTLLDAQTKAERIAEPESPTFRIRITEPVIINEMVSV